MTIFKEDKYYKVLEAALRKDKFGRLYLSCMIGAGKNDYASRHKINFEAPESHISYERAKNVWLASDDKGRIPTTNRSARARWCNEYLYRPEFVTLDIVHHVSGNVYYNIKDVKYSTQKLNPDMQPETLYDKMCGDVGKEDESNSAFAKIAAERQRNASQKKATPAPTPALTGEYSDEWEDV